MHSIQTIFVFYNVRRCLHIDDNLAKMGECTLHCFCCLYCSILPPEANEASGMCMGGVFRQACWYSLIHMNQRRTRKFS